jgi:hypothetical protein
VDRPERRASEKVAVKKLLLPSTGVSKMIWSRLPGPVKYCCVNWFRAAVAVAVVLELKYRRADSTRSRLGAKPSVIVSKMGMPPLMEPKLAFVVLLE